MGPALAGSNGIAFHFPDSDLYYFTEYNSEFPSYASPLISSLSNLHGMNSLPTITLAKNLYRRRDNPFRPSRTAEIIAPGASEMTVGPILISDTEISGDEVVNYLTTVEGDVTYIHTALYFGIRHRVLLDRRRLLLHR